MGILGWMLTEGVVMLAIQVYGMRLAYCHGIWDGAFNQFLPRVQREMRFYDPDRAAQILGDADK